MPILDDLPPYRRAKLLWDFAHFGVDGVNDMVRERAGQPCHLSGSAAPAPDRVAVLGCDGRYHLMSGERMLCAEARTDEGWEHVQFCSWTEIDDLLVSGYKPDGEYGSVQQRWVVCSTAEGVLPSAVPQEQRCQHSDYGVFHYWPPPPARTAVVRRLRAALVEALGEDCHLCGCLPGTMVDHDYATGLVRGLLCKLCNRTVEECPHLDGCPKADYMKCPPAAHLALPYPSYLAWVPKAATRQRKVELLGFDPLQDWRPSAGPSRSTG
ncbi:endonuclease domain-containing protein [Streptomyces sp. NPDC017943]|uniref:endonuclease domain-containing protein n=1 Tax=Streptomyces sp. NPDC017943 TaxID=3365019 RepID=UPI003799E0D3